MKVLRQDGTGARASIHNIYKQILWKDDLPPIEFLLRVSGVFSVHGTHGSGEEGTKFGEPFFYKIKRCG